MAPITINGNTINPSDCPPGYFADDASQTKYILIQCHHAPTAEDHDTLATHHVQVQRRETGHTLLCRYEPDDLYVLQRLSFVKHAVPYHTDFVVHRHVWGASPGDSNADEEEDEQAGLGAGPKMGDENEVVAVAVVLHWNSKQQGQDVWEDIQQLDPDAELIDSSKTNARVRVRRRLVPKIAALDSVRSISLIGSIQFHTAKAYPAVAGLGSPWTEAGTVFTGAGQVIAVADTGFDLGSKTDVHFAFINLNEPPAEGKGPVNRVIQLTNINIPPSGSVKEEDRLKDIDESGHGTHVAGIALGYFEVPAFLPNDPRKTKDEKQKEEKEEKEPSSASGAVARCSIIKAPAPQAQLMSIRISENGSDMNPNLGKLFDQTYTVDGKAMTPKIHNNSWGSRHRKINKRKPEVTGYLDADAGEVDAAMCLDPELLCVFSAGNVGEEWVTMADGPAKNKPRFYQQIGDEKCAKNAIVVGSMFNNRWFKKDETKEWAVPSDAKFSVDEGVCYDGKEDKKLAKAILMDVNRVTAGSNKGPTPDNSQKPDIVAPGAGILSARSRGATKQGRSACPLSQFSFKRGTSMAAPIVSGVAAALREACQDEEPFTSGALIKALLINGAVDLVGSPYEYVETEKELSFRVLTPMPPAPNGAQGFGRVSLSRSLVSLTPDGGLKQERATTNSVSGPWNAEMPKDKSRSFLRVTLAYTDVPGKKTTNELTLNVLCTSGGKTITRVRDKWNEMPFERQMDWNKVQQFPNVQRVTVANAVAFDSIDITVTAGVITQYEHIVDQPFAVVWAFDTT